MTPETDQCVLPPKMLHHDEVKLLAERALSVLATRPSKPTDAVRQRLGALCDAFLSVEEGPRHAAILRILQEGIAPCDIVAHIIPAAARMLGERWFADSLSFAEVTIGTARLQEAVRAIVAREQIAYSEPLGTVLLVLPRPEQHSLGMFVAADRFRRLGYDVEFSVSEPGRQLVHRVTRRDYAMVGFTASGLRSLASVTESVDMIRRHVPRKTAMVLGGTAVDQGLGGITRTGADILSSDPKDALTLCGLQTYQTQDPE